LGSGDRRVKVPFEEWELEVLHEVARKRGVSLTQVVREAVRRMLEHEREGEAIERMEAVMEEYMLRTVRALELLRDEVGLMGSGLQEVKAELKEVEEKFSALAEWLAARDRALEELREELRTVEEAVARLEEVIGLLKEEVSELRRRVSVLELSVRESGRRRESIVAREEAEAVIVNSEAVATDSDAGFQLPSFLKDNPWVEILSRKGRS
jgi:chromosome segregation ATPase